MLVVTCTPGLAVRMPVLVAEERIAHTNTTIRLAHIVGPYTWTFTVRLRCMQCAAIRISACRNSTVFGGLAQCECDVLTPFVVQYHVVLHVFARERSKCTGTCLVFVHTHVSAFSRGSTRESCCTLCVAGAWISECKWAVFFLNFSCRRTCGHTSWTVPVILSSASVFVVCITYATFSACRARTELLRVAFWVAGVCISSNP